MIPTGFPAPDESPLTTFRLALTSKVPVDPTALPKLIPDALPPAVVLSPLMVFEVTAALLPVPTFAGVRTMIPVALPFVVLSVLIVFDDTMDSGEGGGGAATD